MSGDRVVLVTGVSRFLGGRVAAALLAEPSVGRVIGVDVVGSPADFGRVEFVRADIRNPIIGKVIDASGVDTVVHTSVIATPFGAGGRTAMKEINVIGTMQLLAACQKAATLRRVVVKSTTAVYGSSPRDPALFTEDDEPRSLPRTGYAKDSVEVEGYVRGLARRRPDVAVTTLRFANFIGPTIATPLTRYFSLPVVPRFFGFDPRLQFVHEDDGVDVLREASVGSMAGTFNVAGRGVLLVSQAIRRAGRVAVQVPVPGVSLLAGAFRQGGVVDFSPEQIQFLKFGRGVDTLRFEQTFGHATRFSTGQAFDSFVAARGLRDRLSPERVAAAELALRRRLVPASEQVAGG